MNIEIVLAYTHTQEIKTLFTEYTNMLIANDSSFQNYLEIQNYDEEILDTLPFLEKAIHMYEKLGFYTIDCYNNSPMDTSLYMRLDL